MTKHKPILADAEMYALVCGNPSTLGLSAARLKDFIRQVEKAVVAKLAEQEPVVWRFWLKDLQSWSYSSTRHGCGEPLYAHPIPNYQGSLDSSEPKKLSTIRCNDCWWHGNEDGLVLAVAKDYPDDEPAKVCPNCKKLGCLMDLDDSNHIPNASKMLTPLAHRKIQSKLAEGYRKIENATVLVNEHGRAAIVNHGGAFYWVENSALAREYDGRPIPVNSYRPTETSKKGVNE